MVWQVPLSDIDLGEEEVTAVEQVLRSRRFSMGEATGRCEQAMAAYLKVRYAFAVSKRTRYGRP